VVNVICEGVVVCCSLLWCLGKVEGSRRPGEKGGDQRGKVGKEDKEKGKGRGGHCDYSSSSSTIGVLLRTHKYRPKHSATNTA
jgi:hypothetical protein